jgi:hypothetical protein
MYILAPALRKIVVVGFLLGFLVPSYSSLNTADEHRRQKK